MNPNGFDVLARAIAGRRRVSRRRAFGQTGGAGLAAALGLAAHRPVGARQVDETDRAGGEGCELAVTGTVRLGPSSERRRTRELVGRLRVRPTASGDLAGGEFAAYDGDTYPVRGQTTGVAVTLLIGLDDGDVVLTGAGFDDLASCRPGNRYSGLLAGPAPGDLGDWQADVIGGGAGVCPDAALCAMDAPCADDERQTVDCRCVTVGNAVCDVECDEGQTLTDDCACVCLV